MRGETKSFQELYDTKYYVKEPLRQTNLAPPRKMDKPAIIQPSPTSSFQSSNLSSNEAPSKDEKKKKRLLFGFR